MALYHFFPNMENRPNYCHSDSQTYLSSHGKLYYGTCPVSVPKSIQWIHIAFDLSLI